MKQNDTVFNYSIRMRHPLMCTAMAAVFAVMGASANAASVVSRGSSTSNARPTVSRANNAETRMPTLNTRALNSVSAVQDTTANDTTEPEPVATPEPAPAPAATTEPMVDEEPIVIENKADQFSAGMAATSSAGRDSNAESLAEMVRRQRAALDAQSASDAANASAAASLASGQSACDIGLRDCMKQKCGNDYSKCAGDGDTIWGDKLDACRRNVTCTAHQYSLFTKEIKADRDMNAKLSAYNKIIDCGNEYNDCIVTECGVNYSKCLGKTAGDAAISKCGTIAKNCTQQDSGLASRTMNVFATLRQDAEKQIVKDEQRLYEMRDKMRSQCQRLGAMFDERSLVCVYTVNFFAGNSTTPTASKKAYAGSSFDCTQDWFGIDVTTFKENAYRYTRSQTSASSALMGSGLGIGVGAVTSGAIDRAIDRQKAEKALKKAEKEHEANYGQKDSGTKSNNSDPASSDGKDNNSDTEQKTPETKQDQTPTTTEQEVQQQDGKAKQGDDSGSTSDTPSDDNTKPMPRIATNNDKEAIENACIGLSDGTIKGKLLTGTSTQNYNVGQDKNKKIYLNFAYCFFTPANGGGVTTTLSQNTIKDHSIYKYQGPNQTLNLKAVSMRYGTAYANICNDLKAQISNNDFIVYEGDALLENETKEGNFLVGCMYAYRVK